MENLKFGRWSINNDSIETIKENQEIISVHKTDLWDTATDNNINYFLYPVDMCLYAWLSNTDILDFNSAFITAIELFKDSKPTNIPNISWKLTLKIQYERINRSIDINSYDGKIKWEQMKNYFGKEGIENLTELSRIDLNEDYDKHKEIVGDKNSRIP